MKPPAAGSETVNLKEFILAQESTDERALAKAKGCVDWLRAKRMLRLDNVAEYCEDISTSIVYDFAQQVDDEQFWRTVFDGLLDYAYRTYFPETIPCDFAR